MSDTQRIAEIELDETSVVRRSPQVEHERKVAIFDLLEENHFEPADGLDGPYKLILSAVDNRLVFDIRALNGDALAEIVLPLASFRRVVKDYFMICESYFEAIKTASPSKIEAIDMGRRGLHNEGADLLKEKLEGRAAIDKDTARRLFTLVCVLHIRA